MKIYNQIEAKQVSEDLTSEEALLLVNNIVKKRNLATLYLKSAEVQLPNIFTPVAATATPAASILTFSLANQTKNHVFAAPLVANGTPSFRALTLADVSDYSQAAVNYWTKSGNDLNYTSGKVMVGTSSNTGANLTVQDSLHLKGTNPYFEIQNSYKSFAIFTEGTTAGNSKLSIYADAQVIGSLHQDGTVTIGKTSLGGYAKLEVLGAINQSSVTSKMLKANANGTLIAAVDGTDYYSPATISAANYWTKTGVNLYYNTGYIGIGTSSVSFPLDILSSGAYIINLQRSGVGQHQIGISTQITNSISDLLFDAGQASSGYLFRTRNASNAIINAIGINRDGNVSIGSANPGRRLDIIQAVDGTANSGLGIGNALVTSRLNLFVSTSNTSYIWAGGSGELLLVLNGTGKVLVSRDTDVGAYKFQVNGSIQQETVKSKLVGTDSLGGLVEATSTMITDLLGTGAYIQNQNSSEQTGVFWISGVGKTTGFIASQKTNGVDGLFTITNSSDTSVGDFYHYNNKVYLQSRGNRNIILESGTGNVGIGTSVPDAKLHVAGDLMVGATNKIGFNYTPGLTGFYNYISWDVGGTGALTIAAGLWTGAGTQQAINFKTQAVAAAMSILNNGNIGIGTTSIPHKLTITGGNLAITSGNLYLASTKYLYFDYGVTNDYAIVKIGTNLSFKTGGDYSFEGGYLLVNRTSSVGSYHLQVEGDTYFNGKQRIVYSDSSYVDIQGFGIEMSRATSYIRPNSNNALDLYVGQNAANSWRYIFLDGYTIRFSKHPNKKLLKTDVNGSLSTASSSDVTDTLGYIPITSSRTITINGITQDLSANRTWNIVASNWTVSGSNIYRNSQVAIGNSSVINAGNVNWDLMQLQVKTGIVAYQTNSSGWYARMSYLGFEMWNHDISHYVGLGFRTIGSITDAFVLTTGTGESVGMSNYAQNAMVGVRGSDGLVYIGSDVTFSSVSTSYAVYINSGATDGEGLYVNGKIHTTDTMSFASDQKLKSEITAIKKPLEAIRKIGAYSYYFRKDNYPSFGFIAQEVEALYPFLVHQEREYKALNYNGMIALIAAGVQENDKRISELEKEVKALKKELKTLKAA